MSDTALTTYFATWEYGATNAKPIFIFGGWLTRPFYYSRLIKKLTRQGFSCVLYIPRRKLIAIGTEYSQVVEATRLAVKDVRQRLSCSGDDKAVVLGVSIGTTFAMEVAKRCEQVSRVALITPAGDFEKHIAAWQKQPYFKRIVASQPTTPSESGKILNKVGSLNDLHLLHNKQVLIAFIQRDQTMHTHIAKELLQRLQAAHMNPMVLEVKGNHWSGLLRYLVGDAYVSFLLEAQ